MFENNKMESEANVQDGRMPGSIHAIKAIRDLFIVPLLKIMHEVDEITSALSLRLPFRKKSGKRKKFVTV